MLFAKSTQVGKIQFEQTAAVYGIVAFELTISITKLHAIASLGPRLYIARDQG